MGGGGWESTGFFKCQHRQASPYSTAQHSTAQHRTAQHRTAQHRTAPHSTSITQHSTAQHTPAHFVHYSYTARTPITPTTRAPLAHQSHRHHTHHTYSRQSLAATELTTSRFCAGSNMLTPSFNARTSIASDPPPPKSLAVQLVAKLGRQLAYVVLLEAGVCQWVVQLARPPVVRAHSS